MLVFKYIK
jgi:hypothetical protein